MSRGGKTCDACGHKGGTLALRRSPDMDSITDSAGVQRLPAQELCSGELFAVDGTIACLRRMTERRTVNPWRAAVSTR